MGSYIWMAIAGLLVGALAKLVKPGKDPGGFIVTMLIGIAGVFLGNWVRGLLGIGHDGEFSITSFYDWLFSIGSAVLILFVWQKWISPAIRK